MQVNFQLCAYFKINMQRVPSVPSVPRESVETYATGRQPRPPRPMADNRKCGVIRHHLSRRTQQYRDYRLTSLDTMPGLPKGYRGTTKANKSNARTDRKQQRNEAWPAILSPRHRVARLGPRFSHAYKDVCRLRRAVEGLLRAKHGKVDLLLGAKAQTICRLELNCRIAEQGIRDTPTMLPAELRATRALIAQWTCQRDNALSALLGNADNGPDPWTLLDGNPSGQAADATGDAVGDVEGNAR